MLFCRCVECEREEWRWEEWRWEQGREKEGEKRSKNKRKKRKKKKTNLQVVQLVPLLGEMHPPQLRARPPPPERLVQVQHRDVREVRHARYCFQDPEALDRPPRVQKVQDDAERQVQEANGKRGLVVPGAPLAVLLSLPDGGVVEGEGGELLSHRRDGAGDLLLPLSVPSVLSPGGDGGHVVVRGEGPVLGGRGRQPGKDAHGLESDVCSESGLGQGLCGGEGRHP